MSPDLLSPIAEIVISGSWTLVQGQLELSADDEANEKQKILADATYACLRCGTVVSGVDLGKLPEPTCANCGYRIFRKVRGPAVKSLKGE